MLNGENHMNETTSARTPKTADLAESRVYAYQNVNLEFWFQMYGTYLRSINWNKNRVGFLRSRFLIIWLSWNYLGSIFRF